jgi:hypothetical protein
MGRRYSDAIAELVRDECNCRKLLTGCLRGLKAILVWSYSLMLDGSWGTYLSSDLRLIDLEDES